jgi:hypothetical protein
MKSRGLRGAAVLSGLLGLSACGGIASSETPFTDTVMEPTPASIDAPDEAAPGAEAPPEAMAVQIQRRERLSPFTVVVLPDTQFYASSFPEVFEAQTEWIVKNKEAQRIAFVLHEGDIVNFDEKAQWERAANSMRKLDGVVPYALTPGNHDLPLGNRRSGGLMNEYFPVSHFLRYPWFRETYEPNDIENSYMIVDGGGQKWLVLSLEFGPRDGVLEWAGQILRKYPTTPAIVVTHAYLYPDSTRYDIKTRPDQEYSPHHFELEGGANDGEEMWQKLVSKHDNVKFVLSGHMVEAGRLTSVRESGTKVHQILANYQTCWRNDCPDPDGRPSNGGNGWLRLMRFEPARNRVTVRTYSPYLKEWKTDPKNEFVIDLE